MNRRECLSTLAAGCAVASTGCATPHGSAAELEELGAVQALQAIRTGDVAAERYAAVLLAKCEAARGLNAFTHLEPQAVLAGARAVDEARKRGETLPALAGLPLLVKDNIDIAGLPTTGATSGLRGHRPAETAPALARLQRAGALVLAKTNMGEMALSGTSSESMFGPVRNPYDPSRFAGGSSGGTAAALALRAAPAGLGSDTAGSGRIPAAFCGVVGFRPGTHAGMPYPSAGILPLANSLDTMAPLARSVEDVALLDAVLRGLPARRWATVAPGRLRLGVSRTYLWNDLEPEVARVTRSALDRLHAAGVTLVDVELGDLPARAAAVQGRMMMAGMQGDLKRYLQAAGSPLRAEDVLAQIQAPGIARLFKIAARLQLPPDALQAARAEANYLAKQMEEILQRVEVGAFVFPCEPITAQKIKDPADSTPWMVNGKPVTPLTLVRNTCVAAGLGLPALTLPSGRSYDGLPVSLELDGLRGRDAELLAAAATVESILGRLPAPAPAP